jgi:hypothetical protein
MLFQGAAMLRKFVCAAVVVVVGLGVAMADEFGAVITKVDGNKVTFQKVKKGEKSDPMTLPVKAGAKITKGMFNKDTKKFEAGDAIDTGLKNEMFTKIDAEKGLAVRITTDEDNKNITAITVGGKKKKAQ